MGQLPVLDERLDSRRAALAAELAALLGANGAGGPGRFRVGAMGGVGVRFGRHDRMLYATDASLYQVEPLGVVVPASVEEAARVAAWCGRRGVGLLARGGGTSLAGQCVSEAVVVDLSANCRGLKWVRPDERTCLVEPGIYVDELNEELRARGSGLFFAPDPATVKQATIGGCIGNNAAGARSIKYGRTSENVAAVEVALSTGERAWLRAGAGREDAVARRLAEGVAEIVREHAGLIRERFPKTIRRNAGYGLDAVLGQLDRGVAPVDLDLSGLLCGSEGTLALTLGAELKLHPAPAARGLAVVAFESIEAAIGAVEACIATGASAVELLDDVVLSAARGNIEYSGYVDLLPRDPGRAGDPGAVLYVEYLGFGAGCDARGEVAGGFAKLRGALPRAQMLCYDDEAAMLSAWKLRRAGEPLLHGLPGKRKPVTFVEDNAVPVARLGEFVARFKEIVGRHGTRAAYWAHASVGVLHVRPMIDLHDGADRARLRSIAMEVADLAREMGGVMSGEHGDGRVRGPLLERFFGRELMDAFRRVKRVFDPAGVMNPGNIVWPGAIETITESMRTRPRGREVFAPEVDTYFDYSDQHGLGGAVEMCNGSGVCRKRLGGTMCPSYMGTLDERHSTRGRGNALRLAITGQLDGVRGGADFDDRGTIETLDLCLSCKACKSECPSNVDIAMLKAEYAAQRYRGSGGAPPAARVMGHVRPLNRMGSALRAIANPVSRSRAARRVMRRTLGIDERRDVPRFERSMYARWKREVLAHAPAGGPRVVVFADCFTAFNEPRIGVAAGRVLAAAGYRPELSAQGPLTGGGGCCGRGMISLGLLADAAAEIDETIGLLRPAIESEDVAAVVFCEPSCLSAIKDDWLSIKLKTGIALRRKLAGKSLLVEDFIERNWDDHPTPPRVDPSWRPPRGVVLHAHCHQKSLWGGGTSERALRRIAESAGGVEVRSLDSGCCGMAGSFGYAAHRYDLSMRIGELSLLPAARAAAAEGEVVAAPGTSCRHQIREGAGVEAVHPIELIAGAMGVGG